MALAISGFAMSLAAQSATTANTQWSAKSRRDAEDAVARQLESMRASAKLSKLKRVHASVVEVQLVCTGALTGNQVSDPRFGALETYVTDNLSAETESLKRVALGTSLQTADPVTEFILKIGDDTQSSFSSIEAVRRIVRCIW